MNFWTLEEYQTFIDTFEKGSKQDYSELYEKERQQKKLQQEKINEEYWDKLDMKRILFKRQQASKAYDM